MSEDITNNRDYSNVEINDLSRSADGEADGKSSPRRQNLRLSKLIAIRHTIDSLDSSLKSSRDLEAELWLRYSSLKTKKKSLSNELKEADKRNAIMLNLFRRNVTDFDCEAVGDLPQNLNREVQRTWHGKYDALLKLNQRLKSEIFMKNTILEEKRKQIDVLEQRLLNLAESLIQREETVKSICTKYLTLKKRKDEQEVLLRGSIDALQDALQKANGNSASLINSEMTLIPSKASLLARETRRSDRLARENSLLREFLREARRECNCLKSQRSSSLDSLGNED